MGCGTSARATMLVFFVVTGNLAGAVGAPESVAICPGASVTFPRGCKVPNGAELSWTVMRNGDKVIIYDLVKASDWSSRNPTWSYKGRVELTADMSLRLKGVGERDRGVYELDYKHNATVKTCQSYDLRVTGPPPIPSLDVHPKRIVEGGNVTLSCRVPHGSGGSGDLVTVSWFRDGCPLGEDAGSDRSLALISVDSGAVGHYSCVLSNACGRSSTPSVEARVDVHYEPERMKLRADWMSLDADSYIIRIRIRSSSYSNSSSSSYSSYNSNSSSYSNSSSSSSSNSGVDILPEDEETALARGVYDAVRALLRAASSSSSSASSSASSPPPGDGSPRQPGKYPTLAGIFPAEEAEAEEAAEALAAEASELTRGLLEEGKGDDDVTGWVSAELHAAARDALRAFSGGGDDDGRRRALGAAAATPRGGGSPPCPAASRGDGARGALVRLAYPGGPGGGGRLAARRALSRPGERPPSLFAFGRRSGDGDFVVVVVAAVGGGGGGGGGGGVSGEVVAAFLSVGSLPGGSGCHNATRGGSLTLACVAAPGPGAVCAWSLDGGRLPLTTSSPDACELTVHDLHGGHEGRYECVATNVATGRRATASACVHVRDGIRLPTQPEGNGWKLFRIAGVTIGLIVAAIVAAFIAAAFFIARAFEIKHKAKRIRETHSDSTRRPGSDGDDEANYEDPEDSWPGAEKINQFVSRRDLPGTAPCHDRLTGEPPTSAEAIGAGRTPAVAVGMDPCDYETLQEPLTYAVVNRDGPKPAAAAAGTAPCDYESLQEPLTYAVVNRDGPKPAAAAAGTAREF
ncbi:uncharacterized protein LOC116957285 isoform X2 [Petromyzon marinus]|uniref:uncharacterized protein LOC116957285 isoform X2 n=1 Tax=Petromyzon marinus TaxID=7757 RepID=UPI003F7015E9